MNMTLPNSSMVRLDLRYSDELRETIDDVFARWQETQRDHLLAHENLYIAKFNLTWAIDKAYRDGAVQGKNEREREAHLREILPELHDEVDLYERKVRATEKALRSSEIEAERLRLQVTLAQVIVQG